MLGESGSCRPMSAPCDETQCPGRWDSRTSSRRAQQSDGIHGRTPPEEDTYRQVEYPAEWVRLIPYELRIRHRSRRKWNRDCLTFRGSRIHSASIGLYSLRHEWRDHE